MLSSRRTILVVEERKWERRARMIEFEDSHRMLVLLSIYETRDLSTFTQWISGPLWCRGVDCSFLFSLSLFRRPALLWMCEGLPTHAKPQDLDVFENWERPLKRPQTILHKSAVLVQRPSTIFCVDSPISDLSHLQFTSIP